VTRLSARERAARGVYLLPNLLTTAGLFCGVFSIAQTLQGFFFTAALALFAAQVFDGIDGRVARMTNTTSRFGIEYDSLCDLVSFGIAPSLLIYQWALLPWGVWGWLATATFVACAAMRLARFNTMIGEVDQGYFQGLPVPVASAQLASLVLMYNFLGKWGLPDKHAALLLMTYMLAGLMVSSLPYPSFKQLRLHRRQPFWALVALILSLQLLVAQYELMLFAMASLYVASGPTIALLRWVQGVAVRPEGSRRWSDDVTNTLHHGNDGHGDDEQDDDEDDAPSRRPRGKVA
jgi:CDP-diacylglycerol--serine O-phosphatidyltransferase